MAIKVELNKNKTSIMLPGFIIVGLVALFLLLSACGVLPFKITMEPVAIAIFSLLLISSAYFSYVAIKKIKSKVTGLIVDDKGFTYNATALGIALGYIKWEDVKGLNTVEGVGNKYVAVKVHNPDHYLNKIESAFLKKQVRKQLYNIDSKYSDILITISANGLYQFDFDELEKLLTSKLESYHSRLKEEEE